MSVFGVFAGFFIVLGFFASLAFFVLLFAWAINEAIEWFHRWRAHRRFCAELNEFLAETFTPPAPLYSFEMGRRRREHRRAAL